MSSVSSGSPDERFTVTRAPFCCTLVTVADTKGSLDSLDPRSHTWSLTLIFGAWKRHGDSGQEWEGAQERA